MTNPMDIEMYLEGVEYPCDKKTLIKHAKDKGAPGDVVSALNGLPDKEYGEPSDVSSEIGGEEMEDEM